MRRDSRHPLGNPIELFTAEFLGEHGNAVTVFE